MMRDRMKKRRKALRLTQVQLSKRLGLSPAAYGMYEQGLRECRHEILVKIANALDTTTDYLLGSVDDPRKLTPNTFNVVIGSGKKREMQVLSAIKDFELSPAEILNLLSELAKYSARKKG